MDGTDELRKLLEEIRDIGREHLAEYRRVAAHSVSLQERAVARQEQTARLYRRVVIVATLLLAGLAAFLVYSSAR